MRGKIVLAGLILSLSGMVASAQTKAFALGANELYCSGTITAEPVPQDTYIITGEESNYRITFDENDHVFINKGSGQGVKVGDEFFIVRPTKDTTDVEWTKWQKSILGKLGTVWEDEGRLKVIDVRPDVSIAQVQHACNFVQRGDFVLPFVERPAPPLKPREKWDRFAPANGKTLAMVITGKNFQQQVGRNDIVYINLGNGQGVKVGDYFRIFRYQDRHHEKAYEEPGFAFNVAGNLGPTFGFGQAHSQKYNWSNVPREDVGEGIVLRTAPNSSTIVITLSLREIYPGDYVELE